MIDPTNLAKPRIASRPDALGLVGGFRQVPLEEIRVGTRHRVSPVAKFLTAFSTEVVVDRVGRDLVAKLEARILASKAPPTKVDAERTFTYQVPRTWRDQWKIEHADRWYARRWVRHRPARMTTKYLHLRVEVPINPAVAFPDAGVRAPRLGEPVYVLLPDPPDWTIDERLSTPERH